MKTTRKSSFKRTVALLLTICSLLAVMVPAVSAEGTEGAEGSAVTFEQLTGAIAGDFAFSHFGFGAVSEVNGHDYLFIPHPKTLFVYDLDTWEKVDSERIPFNTNTYGSLVDSNGIVWSYGSNNVLHRYDPVTQKGTLTSLMEFDTSIDDAIEINGKLYLGTHSTARLVEYDPATDTFADLGALSADPAAKRVGTMSYKDGFIYATVNSNTAGKDPHILVKYDLANKKIVETLDFNVTDKEYFSDTWTRASAIVGNTMFIASNNQTKMLAVDISGDTMRIKDPTEMGLPANSHGIHNGISEVIVEKDDAGNVINEKIYFFLRQKREIVDGYGWSGWSYIYEYNSKTGLATPVESFPHSANSKEDWVLDYIHTRRGCLVTVDRPEIEGWTGPSILTINIPGEVSLYNIASGKAWTKDTTLTDGDGAGRNVLCITPGPEGSNKLYIGIYMTGYVSAYDLTTGKMTKYDSYSEQIPQIFWYEGKCYATGYGAASLCEVGINQEVKLLFELNKGNNKEYFHQERLHNVTTGDDKLFVTTAPCKGYLGGYLSWYDLETKTAYVAVEKDKVLYQKEADQAAGIWYDEKTNAPYVLSDADDTTKEFAGLIADQIPKSIVYQDGYVYGGTGISGGSNATPKEGESAVLFAYDVANRKLVTLDVRTAIADMPEIVDNIRSVAADPDVPGKFWGQVGSTLFSFTYDKATETFNVKEELSFSKNTTYYHLNAWTGGPLYFVDDFIIADLREEDKVGEGFAMRMVCKDDPSENYLLVRTTGDRILAMGDDNNFYSTTKEDGDLGRYNTASRIAEIIANKAAKDAAQEKINAIGEVTLESEEAIVAARAAYDALPEEVKGLVSNLDVLTAAEAKLAELKAAAEKAAADKAAADAVAAQIEAIGEVTLESEEVIKAARAAYDALTEEQKLLVSNLDALTAAEAKLAQLQAAADKAAADKAAADAVAAKIEAIGEVTLESEEEIKAARTAYDALTAEQKALVSNLDALTAAESKLAEQKAAADKAAADKAAADAAAAKIEDIGEVTLESEEAIKAAREAYDALTAEQKALVDAAKLTAAEEKLAELKDAAEKAAQAIEAAKDAVGKALAAMTVTNDTSKEAIQKVIDEALAKAGITDAEAAVTDVAVTKATTEKAGSAKITVVITSGKGSESSVNTKTIAKLIPPADPDNPQTGDETNLILPVLLMVISVMGIAVGVIFFRKLSYKGKYLK